MENKLARLEENLQNMAKRIEKIDKDLETLTQLTIAINQLSGTVKHLSKVVEKTDKVVTDIQIKPAEKWENITNLMWAKLSSIVITVILFILAYFVGGGLYK